MLLLMVIPTPHGLVGMVLLSSFCFFSSHLISAAILVVSRQVWFATVSIIEAL